MRGPTLTRRGATRLGDLGPARGPGRAHDRSSASRSRSRSRQRSPARFSLARSAGSGRAAVLPVGAKTGVVALDMSASIAGPRLERVATTLRGIVAANQAIGLVMFSDIALRAAAAELAADAR